MTSFTRKLYNRDPAAAEAFRRAQDLDRQMRYGKAVTLASGLVGFGTKEATPQPFGRRVASGLRACDKHCGQPCCKDGCTLLGLRTLNSKGA